MSETLRNVELVCWNLGTVHPDVHQVRAALAASDLNHNRAENIPPSTAFRRAAKTVAGKDTLARFWSRKQDGSLCVQIDREYENGDGRLHRDMLAVYALIGDQVELVNGISVGELSPAFEHATRTYAGADVSKIVQDILVKDGLGAYSPRKTGGVYFVPLSPIAPDLLDRVASFCSAIGVRLLRYHIPDTHEQRAEIAEAVADSLDADILVHAEAISAYTADTKLGHLANRREALANTETLIDRLAHLLRTQTVTTLRESITDLRGRLDELERDIETARRASVPGRRILGIQQ